MVNKINGGIFWIIEIYVKDIVRNFNDDEWFLFNCVFFVVNYYLWE